MIRLKIFHQIHQTHRALFRAADQVLMEKFGITSAQHAVLAFLGQEDGAAQRAIAAAVGLKKASTSTLVDRMAKKGLIRRAISKHDRRAVEHYLTKEGRAILEAATPILARANAALLGRFSEREQQFLADALHHIREQAQTVDAWQPLEARAEPGALDTQT